MNGRWKNTGNGLVILLLLSILVIVPARSQDWGESYSIRVTYSELTGADSGKAEVTLSITIPAGTPLLGRDNAIGSALSALHAIWAIDSVYESASGLLGPVIPMDVQYTVADIYGSEFIIKLVDAFNAVEDAGFSRFQEDAYIVSTEIIDIPGIPASSDYPDAPRYFAWVVGPDSSREDEGFRNWVIASLINYSASILSFRSEYRRFPNSFAEMRETGHILIEPLNPYTGMPVQQVDDFNPGDLTYEVIDNDRVMLLTYIDTGGQSDVVTREINVASSGAYDLLYRQTAGLSDQDKMVARYVFQLSLILNEYYFENLDLPFRIPQCETEGFAYVSFRNPYTSRDAAQSDSLAATREGDYTYHRISSSAYFIVGYGANGEAILSVSKDFGATGVSVGTFSSE